MRTRHRNQPQLLRVKPPSICSTCFEFSSSDFVTNCWSRLPANPYTLISSGGDPAAKPVSFEKVSESAAAAMKQHPQVVWCDVQDLANLIRSKTVDLSERERNRHLLWKLGQAAIEDFPKLLRFQASGSIDRPTERRAIFTPVALPWSRRFEIVRLVAFNQLKLGRSSESTKVVHDLVFHDPDQPGAFRAATRVTLLRTNGGQQSLLQQILGDRSIADAHQRIAEKVVAVTVQPIAWVESALNVARSFQCLPPRLECLNCAWESDLDLVHLSN